MAQILDYAQGPEHGLRKASLERRVAAGSCTLAVMGLAAIPLAVIVHRMGIGALGEASWACSLPLAVTAVDAAAKRATIGMRIMHLRLAARDGAHIGFWRCSARIVMGIILLPLLPISAFMAYVDARHRTLADRLCETAVWLEPPPSPPRRSGFEFGPLEQREHL